jgi:hypothetical protein
MAKKANTGAKAVTTWLNDKKTMVSPVGTALWASIAKPDDRYGAKFKTSLIIDPNAKPIKAFMTTLKGIVKAAGLDPKLVDDLVKTRENKEGEEVTYFSFTTNAFIDEDTGQYRTPTVYNSKNEVIKSNVWGGDEIRVGFKFAHWKSALGQGLKFYLDSVQLLKKNSNGGGGTCAFEEDDSYEPVTGPIDTVGTSSSVSADALPDNEDDSTDDGDVI